jgi:hypothetical protein
VNYRHFAALVSILVVLFAIHISEAAYLLSRCADRSFDPIGYFGGRSDAAVAVYAVLLACSTCVPVVGIVLTGGLLGFHIWIVGIRGLSTYGWILERRKIEDSKPKVLTEADVRLWHRTAHHITSQRPNTHQRAYGRTA